MSNGARNWRRDVGVGAARSGSKMANQASRSQMMRALLRLRELILSGEFKPGERMSELPLVARLGVSRTPLRLALATLEHEGLLRGLTGGGYAVREFTQADINDAVELRGVLEGTAARFAAERGATRRDIRALRVINDEIEPLVKREDYESFEGYMDLNERFHARMLAIARSPLLERALQGIVSLPFGGVNAMVLTEAELPESRRILVIAHRHHDGMIEAIEARQSARAESLAREHARIALTNLEIVLHHREVLARLPGASLITLPQELAPASR
jgi:GntR family transcriptional regulator of vanillate catabolism